MDELNTDQRETTTTVTVRCTGQIRDAVGAGTITFTFEGDTLRDLLDTFFDEYPVREILIAETTNEATAPGWAPRPDVLPGTWRMNPEGEQTRPFARVLINGRFNEHIGGLDAKLTDGDRVALMKPFVFCV